MYVLSATSGATHTIATVVAEVAIAVPDRNRTALITRGCVALESGELVGHIHDLFLGDPRRQVAGRLRPAFLRRAVGLSTGMRGDLVGRFGRRSIVRVAHCS